MLPKPSASLTPNTLAFEMMTLVKATGFREYDPRRWFEYAGEGVKLIVVDPESVVSSRRQMPQSAHWIVLKGTANTIVDDVERTVREGGSLHVPRAAMYKLANLGKVPLEIIEVQMDTKSSQVAAVVT
jgi:mannose-6-phosphate isomerase-like protein (cupin superfamily)